MQVVAIRSSRLAICLSPYLDSHGEEDPELRRWGWGVEGSAESFLTKHNQHKRYKGTSNTLQLHS